MYFGRALEDAVRDMVYERMEREKETRWLSESDFSTSAGGVLRAVLKRSSF